MNKAFLLLAMGFLILLSSCGDDALYTEGRSEYLKQLVYVVPDRYSGEPQAAYTPSKTAYIRVNQDVKICAMYTLNGLFVASDKTTDNIESVLWILGDESFNIPIFRYTFNEPGHFQAYLSTVDLYSDTLKDTLDIYVNTPISIDLLSPVNGSNQISADKDTTIKLRWDVKGIDEWETSHCYIYASANRKKVWKTPLGEVNCQDGANLIGTFPSDSTIYWGVKVVSKSSDNFEERDSSAIFSFSTVLNNGDSAIIEIPIVYENYRGSDSVNTEIIALDTFGDTITVQGNRDPRNTFELKIPTQTQVEVTLLEKTKTEFGQKSFTIDVPIATRYKADTIYFADSIPPEYEPLKTAFDAHEGLKFQIFENGSGLNTKKTTVFSGSDTLSLFYRDSILEIDNFCKSKCMLQLYLEDYARNATPDFYWNIKYQNDSLYVEGPFLMDGYWK